MSSDTQPGALILRPATEADAIDVWIWRNDPLTRAMSRNRDGVPRADHIAWFAEALADPDRTLLVGEVDGEKVGIVRFDHGAETEISINVNPAQRSRGYGYALLAAALQRVGGEIWAEIRDENLTSRRLFERAGFELQSESEGIRRYVRRAA